MLNLSSVGKSLDKAKPKMRIAANSLRSCLRMYSVISCKCLISRTKLFFIFVALATMNVVVRSKKDSGNLFNVENR